MSFRNEKQGPKGFVLGLRHGRQPCFAWQRRRVTPRRSKGNVEARRGGGGGVGSDLCACSRNHCLAIDGGGAIHGGKAGKGRGGESQHYGGEACHVPKQACHGRVKLCRGLRKNGSRFEEMERMEAREGKVFFFFIKKITFIYQVFHFSFLSSRKNLMKDRD